MRAERGRTYVPLGPPRQHKRTQFRSGSICLASDRVPHIPKIIEGHVPQCVSPKQSTRISLLWRSEKETGNPGDPLFTSG